MTQDTDKATEWNRAKRGSPGPRKCVRCGAPMLARWRPFCSKRCADLDLGQWLTEGYRIPATTDTTGEDEAVPEDEPPDDRQQRRL
ncbi:MAG: DNA gyrase inhibitor YacG [Rhodospirillales bacterium]|nr:MAG: DNA gyrase inhibitor YacG [Rhodospirillales bacterium]